MGNLFRNKWIHHSLLVQEHVQCELLYLKYFEQLKQSQPESLALFGRQVYSQNDEDGIIEEIFRRLKIKLPTFIEIGCGNGLENNTHYMAVKGSSGIWIDGSADNIQTIQAWGPPRAPVNNKVVVKKAFVTRNNVVDLISTLMATIGKVSNDLCDFLTVDVDGNDIYLCEEIFKKYQPKVVSVEYNAILTPSAEITSAYADDFVWAKDDYVGASLGLLNRVFTDNDYKLVCCNLPGVNAFFVRKDLAEAFPNLSVDQIYMPPRYNLLSMQARPWGHPRSAKYLTQHTQLVFE